jgi:pimeloyl-ACP methyl ester carboxylesterase
VVTVVWSHGYGRILADQIGYAHARAEGCKLAQIVQQVRLEHPAVPIYLIGHSAGAAVVMAALENVPPDTVNRAFLLAPSLSAAYDVRCALRGVSHGLHVYYSRRDTLYLGLWTGMLGNSDRRWGPSSGRIGFQFSAPGPEDAFLYAKLCQRPWNPTDRDVGNDGKHYGDYQPDFVRVYVLPLVLTRR